MPKNKTHMPPGQMKPVDAFRIVDGVEERKTFATKAEWKSTGKAEGWRPVEDEAEAEEPETPEEPEAPETPDEPEPTDGQ